MGKAYKPEIMTLAPNQALPYMNGPISFFRIKSITGSTYVEVQIGQNGGFFAQMQVGRKIEMQEPVEFITFRNPNVLEGQDVTVEFYALDGYKDTDDLLSLDTSTPIPVVADYRNGFAGGFEIITSTRKQTAVNHNENVKTTFKNISAEVVYFAPLAEAMPDDSYPLLPGEEFSTTAVNSHYIFCLNGVTAKIAYRTEWKY